ncbi:MAG: hypothetical protein WC087_02960 [Candidatus Paceibacterota bacterium]
MNMERYIEPEAEQPKEEKKNYKGIKQMAQTFGAVLTMAALNACSDSETQKTDDGFKPDRFDRAAARVDESINEGRIVKEIALMKGIEIVPGQTINYRKTQNVLKEIEVDGQVFPVTEEDLQQYVDGERGSESQTNEALKDF